VRPSARLRHDLHQVHGAERRRTDRLSIFAFQLITLNEQGESIMRDLTNVEMEQVGGGLLDISTGNLNVANGLSLLNGNAIASGNDVQVNGNASGNDIAASVEALISGLGL